MPAAIALSAGLAGVAVTTLLARRERQAGQSLRTGLLDACLSLLEQPRADAGLDGYPRLRGTWGGHEVRLAAVPDTLTLKRLPQLWLAATLRADLAIPGEIGLLARPTGAESFALTHRLPERLQSPAPLSSGLLARGRGPGSQDLIADLAAPLAARFMDPCLKEVAVTRRGLRAVVQAREGQRGVYLLLRQSAFDGPVAAETARAALEGLRALHQAVLVRGCLAADRHG